MRSDLINIPTPNSKEFNYSLLFLSNLPEINVNRSNIGVTVEFDFDRPYLQLNIKSHNVRYGYSDPTIPELSVIKASELWLNSFEESFFNRQDSKGNKFYICKEASFICLNNKWVYFELDPEINLTFI